MTSSFAVSGRRIRAAVLSLLLAPFMAGCAGVATEGANIAKDQVVANKHLEAAQAGDAEAQYVVGNAYCCSVNEGDGFYSTPIAVDWLCLSAAQGYAPAMRKLGKIYSGDVIDGVRAMRRVAQGLAGTSTNNAVAYAWLTKAAQRGDADAAEEAADLWDDMNEYERSQAQAEIGKGLAGACRWHDAIKTT